MIKAYDTQPDNYEDLILVKGLGAKNIKDLAMISHLVYGLKFLEKIQSSSFLHTAAKMVSHIH